MSDFYLSLLIRNVGFVKINRIFVFCNVAYYKFTKKYGNGTKWNAQNHVKSVILHSQHENY